MLCVITTRGKMQAPHTQAVKNLQQRSLQNVAELNLENSSEK